MTSPDCENKPKLIGPFHVCCRVPTLQNQCRVQRVFPELFITMSVVAEISSPNLNPSEQEAVIISLARANDQGHTTVVFCLAESGPFRLRNQNNRYIWSNQELRENGINVGSVVTYQRCYQGCLYTANTGKKEVSLALYSLCRYPCIIFIWCYCLL